MKTLILPFILIATPSCGSAAFRNIPGNTYAQHSAKPILTEVPPEVEISSQVGPRGPKGDPGLNGRPGKDGAWCTILRKLQPFEHPHREDEFHDEVCEDEYYECVEWAR